VILVTTGIFPPNPTHHPAFDLGQVQTAMEKLLIWQEDSGTKAGIIAPHEKRHDVFNEARVLTEIQETA